MNIFFGQMARMREAKSKAGPIRGCYPRILVEGKAATNADAYRGETASLAVQSVRVSFSRVSQPVVR
jgi:hypothetical protein